MNYSLCLCLFFLLSACSDQQKNLERYIQTIYSKPAPSIKKKSSFVFLSKFQPMNLKTQANPFKPVLQQRQKGPKQVLERFSLSSLKFVGLVKYNSTLWALIEDPEGLVARVRVGSLMGTRSGRVKTIKNHWLEVEERVKVYQTWNRELIRLYMDKKGKFFDKAHS